VSTYWNESKKIRVKRLQWTLTVMKVFF